MIHSTVIKHHEQESDDHSAYRLGHVARFWKRTSVLLLLGLTFLAVPQNARAQSLTFTVPDSLEALQSTVRDKRHDGKYTPDLAALAAQFGPRPPANPTYSADELLQVFGIRESAPNPRVTVLLEVAPQPPKSLEEDLRSVGVSVLSRQGRQWIALASVRRLTDLAMVVGTVRISLLPSSSLPPQPRAKRSEGSPPPSSRGKTPPVGNVTQPPLPYSFNRQGLTGKGVIVAVIDSGIYWKHPDFIAPDGSSRILALWDPFDRSYELSKGKIGSKPPFDDEGTPLGTLYTKAQLTAALKGNGIVNSGDEFGHGTACASTAAGNGRAPGGIMGVAPEAELIVVNTSVPDATGSRIRGGVSGFAGALGSKWVLDEAARLKKPLVINMSYGSHYSAHDGTSPDEKLLDSLTMVDPSVSAPKAKPGIAFCVAAGNEGRSSMVAEGRFGPRQPGQKNVLSQPIELFLSEEARLVTYLSAKDDWGIGIACQSGPLAARDGRPVVISLVNNRANQTLGFKLEGSPAFGADEFREKLKDVVKIASPLPTNAALDELTITLPPGRYAVVGFSTDKAPVGRFTAYLPQKGKGAFGQGSYQKYMVSSPGNAAGALTIGSYDLLGSWRNAQGEVSSASIIPGDISDYSNPGPRQDGVVKPDIMAPGRFHLSALSPESEMARGAKSSGDITIDGQHLAWEGTSSATPYVAGVVALMFQKNPTLTIQQIRDILARTATVDKFTMGVPSPQWGYGKLNPEAALKATPAASTTRGKQ